MQTRQDHGIELEALGLVQGHELQVAVGGKIGRGKQPRRFLFELIGAETPRRIELVDQREEGIAIGEFRLAAQAGRAAQGEPRAHQPARRRLPALLPQDLNQHRAQMIQARPSVGRKP